MSPRAPAPPAIPDGEEARQAGCAERAAWVGLGFSATGVAVIAALILWVRSDPFGMMTFLAIGLIGVGLSILAAAAFGARFGALAGALALLVPFGSLVAAVGRYGDDAFEWWLMLAPVVVAVAALLVAVVAPVTAARLERRQAVERERALRAAREAEVAICLQRAQSNPRWSPLRGDATRLPARLPNG